MNEVNHQDATVDAYARYCNYISQIIDLPSDAWAFKSTVDYRYMLEHVSHPLGLRYEKSILEEFGGFVVPRRQAILDLIARNDSLGQPVKEPFEFFGNCSPTALRYIYHSLVTLKHFASLQASPGDILEIGGGYGGLCFFLTHLAKLAELPIKSYTIIDLDSPSRLQEKYLSAVGAASQTHFFTDSNYHSRLSGDYFFLSAYCIGEISEKNRARYIQTVLPRCSHGFAVWNSTPVNAMGKAVRIEPERPHYIDTNFFLFF